MLRLSYHIIKVILVAGAIGVIGGHFLMEPISRPGLLTAMSVIAITLLVDFLRPSGSSNQSKDMVE